MKNYLKFIVAVFGITVATFSTIDAKATGKKKDLSDPVKCISYGFCGTTHDGKTIEGHI